MSPSIAILPLRHNQASVAFNTFCMQKLLSISRLRTTISFFEEPGLFRDAGQEKTRLHPKCLSTRRQNHRLMVLINGCRYVRHRPGWRSRFLIPWTSLYLYKIHLRTFQAVRCAPGDQDAINKYQPIHHPWHSVAV